MAKRTKKAMAERKQWLLDNAEMICVKRRVKEKIGEDVKLLGFDWSVKNTGGTYWRGQWVSGSWFGLYMKGSSAYEREMKCVRSYWTSPSRLVYEMVKGGTKLINTQKAEMARRAERKAKDEIRKTGQAKQLADLKAGIKSLGLYGREEKWGSDWEVRNTKQLDAFAKAAVVKFDYNGEDSQRVTLRLDELPMERVLEILPFLMQAVDVARGKVDEDILRKAKEKTKRAAAERGESTYIPKRHVEL